VKKLAIIGSALTGGAAQVIDAVSTYNDYRAVAIFDNHTDAIGRSVFGVNVVASSMDVRKHWEQGLFDEVVLAIGGNLKERERLYNDLTSVGIPFANVIDRTAQIRLGVNMGSGNVILANVFIGPSVSIANNCYIITNTCINHHSKVGSHVYFSAGCTIAGDVVIGNRVRFDTASGAKARMNIADDASVPAGHIVTQLSETM
jgi:acetyltransferase-like isoleucine patch superfamily enzyme